MRRYPQGKASMVSAAKLPISIHVAMPRCSGRGEVGRLRVGGGAWDDDTDGGIGGSGMSGGG